MKKKITSKDLPGVEDETVRTISRIEESHDVLGVVYIKKDTVYLSTVPETASQALTARLPKLNSAIYRALTEIDIQDELVAYRIETKNVEILVAAGKEYSACVLHNVKKKKRGA